MDSPACYVSSFSVLFSVLRFEFGAPSSTCGRNRRMRSWIFSYEIQFWTTFIGNFFYIMRIFCSVEPQRESNFLFLYIIRFQIYWSLEPRAKLVVEIDICAPRLFCREFSSEQLLYEAFFHIMHIFWRIEPQRESNFPFLYIIKFQTYWSLTPPTPLVGDIDICARGLFSTKFSSEQLSTLVRSFLLYNAYF